MRMRAHRARVIKQGYAEHELATLSGRVAILALMAKEIAAIDRYERRALSRRKFAILGTARQNQPICLISVKWLKRAHVFMKRNVLIFRILV
jgi:hypothetical protein